MSLKSRLMSTFSETYRIKNGYGLAIIRHKRILKALIYFCRHESREYRKSGFDGSSHLLIWEETVRLYDKWKLIGYGYTELEDYIEAHIGYYWS